MNHPEKHPVIITRSEQPLDAEPPKELLRQSFTTPTELFFVRNHGSIPRSNLISIASLSLAWCNGSYGSHFKRYAKTSPRASSWRHCNARAIVVRSSWRLPRSQGKCPGVQGLSATLSGAELLCGRFY